MICIIRACPSKESNFLKNCLKLLHKDFLICIINVPIFLSSLLDFIWLSLENSGLIILKVFIIVGCSGFDKYIKFPFNIRLLPMCLGCSQEVCKLPSLYWRTLGHYDPVIISAFYSFFLPPSLTNNLLSFLCCQHACNTLLLFWFGSFWSGADWESR